MVARHNLFGDSQRLTVRNKASTRKRGVMGGWLIIVVLTCLYLTWLGYRWLNQPIWTQSLSSPLTELLDLMEMAAAMTLIMVWLGLLLRWLKNRSRSKNSILDLDQLFDLSPTEFEHYVARLFRRKGYKVVVRGGSGDHGVDLELFGDGSKRAVVQCKRYRDTVGEDVVRDLYGTLLHERAARAFLVTTAEISEAARKWSVGKPITLIDGDTLVAIGNALI